MDNLKDIIYSISAISPKKYDGKYAFVEISDNSTFCTTLIPKSNLQLLYNCPDQKKMGKQIIYISVIITIFSAIKKNYFR